MTEVADAKLQALSQHFFAGRVAGLHSVSTDAGFSSNRFALPFLLAIFEEGWNQMVNSNGWAPILSKVASRNTSASNQITNRRILLQQLGKCAGQYVLLAASLACSAFPSHAANPDLIPVANHTNFSDEALGKYLAENLNQNLKEEMAKRSLAVFAISETFPGRRACFAAVGITGVATASRNARLPINTFAGYQKNPEKNWDTKTQCGSETLANAVSRMNSTPVDEVLRDVELTNSDGGTRPNAPFERDKVALYTFSIEDKKDLFAEILEHRFSAAFDNRHVQTTVYAAGIKFDDGDYMCVAFAGLTANNPNGRTARWPAVTTSYVRLQTGGTVEVCKGIVAKQAIHELLEKSWTADGLLKSFALTREDGIPLPDAAKVAKSKVQIDRAARALAKTEARRAKQPKSVKVVSTTRTSNRLSCQNSCVNGSCVRTLPDGSREQWQASRKFDPFSNNWGWDTTTNACGI